jgi:hypothetical protein
VRCAGLVDDVRLPGEVNLHGWRQAIGAPFSGHVFLQRRPSRRCRGTRINDCGGDEACSVREPSRLFTEMKRKGFPP